jgi:hypothetical protein
LRAVQVIAIIARVARIAGLGGGMVQACNDAPNKESRIVQHFVAVSGAGTVVTVGRRWHQFESRACGFLIQINDFDNGWAIVGNR